MSRYAVTIVLVDESENERFTLTNETFSRKADALAAFRRACQSVKNIYRARVGFWGKTDNGGRVTEFRLRSPYSPYRKAYVHLVVL